jgi:3'-phosphoadenosine 5'-phosphosulfate sulfotransferase (PAPS reductase)/FAD synthetase
MVNDGFPTERFLLRSRLSIFRKRVERAEEIIREALSLGLCWYTTCSAGKDSVVLSHLVSSISPGIEVWSEKDEFDFPGEVEYLENLREKFGWNLNIVRPDGDMTGFLETADICEDLHSRKAGFSSKFFYALIERQEARFNGVFLGLRAEESIGRRLNFRKRGEIYRRSSGKWTCIPLANFEGEDIFAYLVSREIPILDVYKKTMFHDGDPCRIRKAWFLPSGNAKDGQCAWLKYYYPALYAKLLKLDPRVAGYG